MALDRELRRLLEYARLPETDSSSLKDANPPRPTARGILDRITAIHQQTCVPSMGVTVDMNLPELLVLTAEAAIFQGDFQTASKSVEAFFSECRLKNQFYCRAQFVHAHCGSHAAQSTTGVTKLKTVLNAIHFILAVIPIATDTRKRPMYDFLVYNASVTYWQIARQLMKQSTFQFLVPSLTKVIDALKLTAESDVAWLLRLQIALVYAQVDANQLVDAAKTINDVVDVQMTPRLGDPAKASDKSFKDLYEEALRIQVHVGSFKDPECQKIVPNVKRLLPPTNKRSSLLVKLQCVKSGNLAGTLEAAYVEIFQEATGFLAFAAETPLGDVKTFVGSLEPRALEAIDAEVVVETAIHAAFNKVVPIAAACEAVLQRKGKSMPPKIRVLCQVLSAVLLVVMPSTRTGGKVSCRQRQSRLLARRVEGMKAFERALLASKRQQDPHLVERVCIYAWNLSLPLLQPHLRNQLARVVGLSSSILEELDSLLLGFRARLYLEMAKLEVASDFLAKASVNISKALSLDYGTITRGSDGAAMSVEVLSEHEDWIARPVDTHLFPIKQKLDLKLAAEDSPSTSVEVLAMLEQVKEGKDPHQQRSTLTRCIETMTEISSASGPRASADHVRLWSEISSLAWNSLHDSALAQRATEMVLSTYFAVSETGEVVTPKSISGEKSLMILEVDMRLLMVEILATKLKEQATQVDTARRPAEHSGSGIESPGGRSAAGRRSSVDLTALVLLGKETYVLGIHRPHAEGGAPPPVEPGAEGAELEENAVLQARQNTLDQEIQAVKKEILGHLTRALKAATTIGWTFVLENTCIYLWNYHFHIFRMLLEASQTSPTDAFDPQWILPECVSAFEAVYAALEATATGVDRDLLASVGFGLSSIYKQTGRLDKALAIADTFLKRKPFTDSSGGTMSVLHLKRFAELKSRVQIAQNAKDISPTDGTTAPVKVAAYLEAMEVTFSQMALPAAQQPQLLEKAQGLYQKAIAMWQTSAPEILNSFMSDEFERGLEEEQQLMELYVEIWVRVGCGAFRLKNTKFAIECAEQALLSLEAGGEGKKAKQRTQLLVVGSTWKWFASAELLYGRAILALGEGETPAQKLLLASLSHLVRAIEYGLRGNLSTIVIRACEVIWNATFSAINRNDHVDGDESEEANFFDRVVGKLRRTLRYLDQVVDSPEADLNSYGEMVLLTLAMCEKANRWSDQFEICEAVLKTFGPTSHRPSLPSEIMKEIQTASAISGARLGKPASMPKSGGSSKSPDQLEESLVQAQILKKVAFSSWKDPPAQLKALSNAYVELDGQPEEQALVLVDIAEWLFTNQLSTPSADAYLECATSALLNSQKQKQIASQAAMSRKASTGQLSVAPRQKSNLVYSPLWFAEKQLRIFVMRATLSKTCIERSQHVRLALYEVEKAWEHILVMMNEIEFRATYDRENPDPVSRVEFDQWKKVKTPKYSNPVSERDWISFFIDHDENATNRFYMPWAKALQSVQATSAVHITQPVLTLTYLEDLLAMLREDGLQYSSMIPSFCLYTVLFHTFVPRRTCMAQIWLELSQFDLMERLDMSNFSLPLQNALDMIQSRGDSLIKELQEVQASTGLPEGEFVSRKRHIFHSTHLDTRAKAVASIQLLLQFGFVRQAKTILEILRFSADNSRTDDNNNTSSNVLISECEVLSSHVLELEGQTELAFARAKRALETSQLDVCRFLEWTLRCCKLIPDLDQSLNVLRAAERQTAKCVVAGLRRPVVQQTLGVPYKDVATSSPPDIAVVQLTARVTFQQAMILLKKAGAALGSSVLDHLQESKRALEKSMRLLTLVDAHYLRSQLLVQYSGALQSFERSYGTAHVTSAGLDAKWMLQEALALQETCFESQFYFSSSSPPQMEKYQQETTVAPLGLKIALTKLQVARLLMVPELSPAAIKEKEMTWYRYDQYSQRSIVEKWLHASGSVLEKSSSFELPRAMTLISSAIDTLADNATFEIQHAIAQVLRLQCQRLALFHGDDKQKADALRSHLWTRYTSSDARHATWVCCHGARAQLAVAAANQTASQNHQIQTTVQDDDDPEKEEEEEEGADEAHLEEMLTAHAANLQKYQLIAFEKQCAELLRLCSNELVQVLGCRHPFDCAKNVLKHQSAEVIEVATTLFEDCVSESNAQRLHLRRMKKLQKTHTSASAHSLPFQLSQLYLNQQSESFKRMSVGTRVDEIVAALPSSIRIMCLHFSPDRCYLYAALLGSTESRVAISRMEFTDTQTALLGELRTRVQDWRGKCAKETLAYEDAHGQDELYEFTSADTPPSDNASDDEDLLEDEFTTIINDTIALLNPLFTHSAMAAELTDNLAGNTLVLLLDRVLACLPMEALPALQPADAIARDFSIQILHHRLMAMKKQPMRPTEMRVIVDPHKEDPGDPSGQTMASVVKEAAAGWKDACEHGQVPSVTDWQQTLLARRGGGLLYVGPNRVLGSCLPLQRVTGMNVALTCQALILLDHAENSKSARRQSKVDSEKPAWEKEIECDPYARALLLTLCGVNILAVNQWTTTFNGNRRLANGLLQNMSRGFSVGKALKKFGESTMAASASAASLPVVASDPTEAAAAPSSPTAGSDGAAGGKRYLKNRFRYNPIVYGLANVTLKSSD
ncbi:hypothetical protein PHYPSEUDO_013774 [Phytophthora pseudosyringae]|uniref:Uncharacterized protein n=1 Tax=Phytophthora pseudosyringae TaxID=221518 RepID=A0A8T1V4X3_9STRA|nr:hypothetical protein PHYPSEUDO_013774 [Phytophthora pseudosyringae]